MQQTPALDEVRRIVLDAVRGHAERVLLFGSWARGNERRSSDVDVAVQLAPGAPRGLRARLRDDLQHSNVREETVRALEMTDDRNRTSHTYHQFAQALAGRIPAHAQVLRTWLDACRARA